MDTVPVQVVLLHYITICIGYMRQARGYIYISKVEYIIHLFITKSQLIQVFLQQYLHQSKVHFCIYELQSLWLLAVVISYKTTASQLEHNSYCYYHSLCRPKGDPISNKSDHQMFPHSLTHNSNYSLQRLEDYGQD